MRKTALASIFILSALVGSCDAPEPARDGYRDRPAKRFQGDTSAAIFFTTDAEVRRRCPQVQNPVGCTVGHAIYVPNPCRWQDPYADLLCHEMGHRNGMPADHSQ